MGDHGDASDSGPAEMTLGIGMACPEGVLLASDSLTLWAHESGSIPQPASRKTGWLRAARVAYVASGMVGGPQEEEAAARRREASFDATVAGFFDDLVQLERAAACKLSPGRYAALADAHDPQLIAAGGPPGAPPRLAHLSATRRAWGRTGRRAVYVVGGWTHRFVRPRRLLPHPVPASLQACRELALEWARGALDFVYGGKTLEQLFFQEGKCPPIGWPLYVTRITTDDIIAEEVYQ